MGNEKSTKSEGKRDARRQRKMAEDLRGKVITVRVTNDEYRLVEQHRKSLRMTRGGFVRLAAFNKLPTGFGSLNRSAWRRLAQASEGLLRLADWVDSIETSKADVVAREVALLASLFREVHRRVCG